jgi:arylsulfatase A
MKPAVTPTSNGFDYFFGIQASLDMAPYVYIENEQAIADASVTKGFNRKGAAAPDFEAVDCLGDFAEKAVAFIDRCVEKPGEPFFLYLPLTSPHTPIVPSEAWEGKSSIGQYGDFLMETDWVVGEVLGALDRHGVAGETLVIFTTDNGCSPAAKIDDLVEKGHKPNGDLRGHKADIFDGGHRVPFVVRWPGVVEAGTETSRLTCQTDILATCAEIVGRELKAGEGVDSVSFLATLKDASQVARDAIVHHSINGSFAIREGKWKLCLCPDSGGWSEPKPGKAAKDAPPVQLFDLEADPGEEKNLAEDLPEKVEAMTALMQRYVDEGRSTPGERQSNDGETSIWGPVEQE